MAIVELENIRFREKNGCIEVVFMHHLGLKVLRSEFENIGKFSIENGTLEFSNISDKRAHNKIQRLLKQHKSEMKNLITKKPVTFIAADSEVPLIGSAAFGIVDRNSNLIEVKPITGCNMNCIFCSVDEGLASKKVHEIIIEPHYLADECRKVVEFKNCDCQVTINSHGEPLLYGHMPLLISLLKGIKEISQVSLITNGTLLTKGLIDELAEAGLDSLNISLNAIDEKTAKILEGHGKYDVNQVKEMARYAATKLRVIIAPVYVPSYNEQELKKLVLFGKEIGATMGIQNYLSYDKGRNPTETEAMDVFYDRLRDLEKETGVKLIVDMESYGIIHTKPLPKPFRKGMKVKARIAFNGRYAGEKIAVAEGRVITVPKCILTDRSTVHLTITGDKHNLFFGKAI